VGEVRRTAGPLPFGAGRYARPVIPESKALAAGGLDARLSLADIAAPDGVSSSLGPVVRIDLVEDSPQPALDRALGDEQLERDLFVRQPSRNLDEDLCFPLRQLASQHESAVAVSREQGELFQHSSGDAWMEHRLTPTHGKDRAEQVVRGNVLE